MAYGSVVEVTKGTVVEVTAVIAAPHGQSSDPSSPTAKLSVMSASVEVTLLLPFGSHTHSGVQTAKPTDTFRMNNASVEVGISPSLDG